MIVWLKRRLLHAVHWLGGVDLLVLLGLLLLVGGVWAFVALADAVLEGETQSLDERLLLALRGIDRSGVDPKMAEEIGRDLTALGGIAVLSLMTAAVVGYLVIDRKYHAAGLVLLATLGGLLLSALLKHAVDRPRPHLVEHRSYAVTSSFPSGHSMMAAVVYLTLGSLLGRFVKRRRLKLYVLTLAVALAVLVGLSRVYLGVHYPTDVLAGWSAGLAWAVLCWLGARYLQRRGAVERAA